MTTTSIAATTASASNAASTFHFANRSVRVDSLTPN